MHPTIERLREFKETHGIPNIEISLAVKVREMTVYRWFSNSHNPHPQHVDAIEKFIDKYEKEVKAEYEAKLRKVRAVVLAHCYNGLGEVFKSFPHRPTRVVGVIHKDLKLEDVGRDSGLRMNDPALTEGIEQVCRKGKIKIWAMTMSRSLRSDDIKFRVEIGTGRLHPPNPRIESDRLYRDDPLSADELKGEEVILNIIQLAERLRQRKTAAFAATRGVSGLEMEARLHREDVMAEHAKRQEAASMASDIKKLAKEKPK